MRKESLEHIKLTGRMKSKRNTGKQWETDMTSVCKQREHVSQKERQSIAEIKYKEVVESRNWPHPEELHHRESYFIFDNVFSFVGLYSNKTLLYQLQLKPDFQNKNLWLWKANRCHICVPICQIIFNKLKLQNEIKKLSRLSDNSK